MKSYLKQGILALIGVCLGLMVYGIFHIPKPIQYRIPAPSGKWVAADKPYEVGQTVRYEPTEPKWASDLRSKADSMGLQWSVYCHNDEQLIEYGHKPYFAYAKQPQDHGLYIEDGALPSWYAEGNTMEQAGKNLLTVLSGKPNRWPSHNPGRRKSKAKQCTDSISGGPGFPEIYADKEHCKDCALEKR